MSFRCEAAAATTCMEAADLSISMGSDEEADADDDEPDEVSEFGVEAADTVDCVDVC